MAADEPRKMRVNHLRLHAWMPCSRANGPGVRAVVWTQGCTLGCPGCFNPKTHPFDGGQELAVEELFGRIVALGGFIEGITLSGGEPLQQLPAVLALLRRLRAETTLSVILFTGYEWAEVQAMPESDALLACVDVLIAGRYIAARRLAQGLRGSSSKTVHLLTDRYSLAGLEQAPSAEVIISPDGHVRISGIEPVELSTAARTAARERKEQKGR